MRKLHDQEDLDDFLRQYEEGIDIGIKKTPPPNDKINNPPMDIVSKVKMGETILKWYNKGYLMGPFETDDPRVKDCRLNPVFTVPKPDGSVRPVVNYSKKIKGSSLNEMLKEDLCTVEYIKLKEITYTIQAMGVGAMMWAKDLEDGYFNIKIHPTQTKLISFMFLGLIFVPMVLVFGLSSAPLIFTVFMYYVVMAIRLNDIPLNYHGIHKSKFIREFFQKEADTFSRRNMVYFPLVMYYLDDIFGVQTPQKVWKQYDAAGTILKFLGLSAKEAKDRPPAPIQIILGLEFDTIKQEIRTPQEKVKKYKAFAKGILAAKKVLKKKLFSLTGKVRHTAGQCRPLAAYARGIEAHGTRHEWNHHINISRQLRIDIQFTISAMEFAAESGVKFNELLVPDEMIQFDAFTDATSVYGGIGGYIHQPNAPWFQVAWSDLPNTQHLDILWKEMAAIAVLIDIYKYKFQKKYVRIWTDNESIKWMLLKWRAPLNRPDLQKLIRFIAQRCIYNHVNPWFEAIRGEENVVADKLSRFESNPFKSVAVTPREQPTKARDSILRMIDECTA